MMQLLYASTFGGGGSATIVTNVQGHLVSSSWKRYDLSVAGAYDAWQGTALNMTQTGFIDSVFADGCFDKEHGPGITPAHSNAMYEAKEDMLRDLQTKLPGPIVCGSTGDYARGVGAVQAEGFGVKVRGSTQFATREIPQMMAAAAAGVIYQAHGRAACGQDKTTPPCCDAGGPPCNCTTAVPSYDANEVQNEIAAFLIGASVQ